MDQSQYLDCLNKFIDGMIKKDKNLLDDTMSKDAILYHMTGHKETKEEYIKDILDGTLNYYDYKIISFSDNVATIKLLAKVYGSEKSWWTLKMYIEYTKEDNKTKIKTSKVRLG